MNGMLIMCTKNVNFTFESKTHVQTDGVAMGSLLGLTLVDIFMIELESSLPTNLTKYIKFWKWYVDDTTCFVYIVNTEFIISVFKSFDKSTQFQFEEKNNETIPFLDKYKL